MIHNNMKTFGQILNEDKNLHLVHIEDLVFEGSSRVNSGISLLKELMNMLSGESNQKVNVSTKWDGAPSIICGTNPENGKFFVGTKSVFNKKTPKINYTEQDIRSNHPSGLASKLIPALKHLKDLPIKGVIQGDMLYTQSDLSTETIKGESYVTFTPNTITYAVPNGTNLATRIKNSKLGIVFHTKYTGDKLAEMSASFDPNVSALKRSTSIWVDDAKFKDMTGVASFTKKEADTINTMIQNAETMSSRSKKFIDDIKTNSFIIGYLNIYVNSKVRQGIAELSAPEFLKFISDREEQSLSKLKRKDTIKRKEKIKKTAENYIKRNMRQLQSVFDLHKMMTKAKIAIVRKLESINAMQTFVKTDNGFKVTGQEGYVATDKFGKNTLKLVDRMEFSKLNFTLPKNWIKG
jgi:hypothetical protein